MTIVARPHAEVYGLSSSGRDRDQFAQANGTFAQAPARPLGLDLTAAHRPCRLRRHAGARLLERRGRPADDRTSGVPAPTARVPAVLRARRELHQLQRDVVRNARIPAEPDLLFACSSGRSTAARKSRRVRVAVVRRTELPAGSMKRPVIRSRHRLRLQARPARPAFIYWADGVLAHHSLTGDDSTVFEAGVAGRNLGNGFVYGVDEAVENNTYAPGRTSRTVRTGSSTSTNRTTKSTSVTPTFRPTTIRSTFFLRPLPTCAVPARTSTSSVRPGSRTTRSPGPTATSIAQAVHEADALVLLTAALKNGFSLNNVGPQIGSLRNYVDRRRRLRSQHRASSARTSPAIPCYLNGRTDRFNSLGRRPRLRGRYAVADRRRSTKVRLAAFTHLYTASTSRQLGTRYSLGLEYDGTFERDLVTGLQIHSGCAAFPWAWRSAPTRTHRSRCGRSTEPAASRCRARISRPVTTCASTAATNCS